MGDLASGCVSQSAEPPPLDLVRLLGFAEGELTVRRSLGRNKVHWVVPALGTLLPSCLLSAERGPCRGITWEPAH